ncbi:MAG: DUF1501 domain-containing protein [Candidatus Eremiobacteraeota bacterium]|nr:DUF1501 domain-containing protein [Candidatus Eremiobacteraeota bacterium]
MLFSRRRFLCGATAATLAVPAFLRSLEADAAANMTLVAILQDGGCDGLNTVVPLSQYGVYSGLRQIPGGAGTLAVLETDIQTAGTAFDANYTTPASSATTFAFHPNMTALRALYGQGKVAVLLGVGIPPADDNRTSHEVGKFDWATATINKLGYTNLGWLGQAFDTLGGGGAIPPTVSLNYSAPTIMHGVQNTPLVLGGDIGNFSVPSGAGGSDATARLAALATDDGYALPSSAGEFARSLASATTGYVTAVQGYATTAPGTGYGSVAKSGLKFQLLQIARLIKAGAPSRAYFASQGGYDTHSQQNAPGFHPSLVGELSDAIAQFYAYLAANSLSQNVVVMTYTDFGRRVQANSTAGTDHGTAQVGFVVGDPVKPGVYGNYPDLTKLDHDGNPVISVDFRNHISDLIGALGADPRPIVGTTYPKLGYI